MRKTFQVLIIALLSFWMSQGCSNSESSKQIDKEKLTLEIKNLEDTLQAKADQPIDQKLASKLIQKNITFTEVFPEDQMSPAYLFRAGNIAVGIGSFNDAVKYFERVHQNYSDYERAPDALFLEGFTYENHLKDINNAKKCYNDFLQQFPNNQLADQVRVVLQNIEKSPEELVKSFQEK